jgi:hypothetical protein
MGMIVSLGYIARLIFFACEKRIYPLKIWDEQQVSWQSRSVLLKPGLQALRVTLMMSAYISQRGYDEGHV